jgi:hypothetical protein
MGAYCNCESWKAHYVPHGFSKLPLVNLYIVDYGRTLTQRRGENPGRFASRSHYGSCINYITFHTGTPSIFLKAP